MTEHVFDLDAFEGEGMDDGLREEVVRCRDCRWAREAYWHDGERRHPDPPNKCCGYFVGAVVPPDFFCAVGERRER